MNEGRDQRNCPDRCQRWASAIDITNRMDSGKMDGLRGLRGCRERLCLRQDEAAEMLGVSQPTWSAWERCQQWPYSYYLPRLAVTLGVSIEELFLGPEDTEEDTT